MLAKWHYHIEISSKCTLACPRCARTEVPESLINTQLDLEFFTKNFTKDILDDVEKVTFCGDDGDPIYARDLISVITYLKTYEVDITIVTNGSYKSADWWSKLAMVLGERDVIHFSMDGWDNRSNNLYRVNSDWDSIMVGFMIMCRSKAIVVRDVIAFKFNEDHIDDMISQTKQHGADIFQLTKSTKFGSVYPSYGDNDPLEPSSMYVSSTDRFEREYTILKRSIPQKDIKDLYDNASHDEVTPLCYVGSKGLFINSRGEFYPCCWVANRYKHNEDWQGKFDLHKSTLSQIFNDEFWEGDFKTFKWYECQTKCSSKQSSLEKASEW